MVSGLGGKNKTRMIHYGISTTRLPWLAKEPNSDSLGGQEGGVVGNVFVRVCSKFHKDDSSDENQSHPSLKIVLILWSFFTPFGIQWPIPKHLRLR